MTRFCRGVRATFGKRVRKLVRDLGVKAVQLGGGRGRQGSVPERTRSLKGGGISLCFSPSDLMTHVGLKCYRVMIATSIRFRFPFLPFGENRVCLPLQSVGTLEKKRGKKETPQTSKTNISPLSCP